jgi:hypothetical protein
MLGIVVALFHDVGYLRTTRDTDVPNGAEFTTVHVSRGAAFLTDYLPKINLGQWAKVAAEIIHYTATSGRSRTSSRPIRAITSSVTWSARPISWRRWPTAATSRSAATAVRGIRARRRGAADRRERPREGALRLRARPAAPDAEVRVRHARQAARRRFNRAYRYLEVLYGGRNPYMESIDRNLEYLQRILRSENWRLLRRQPPVFTGVEDSMATTRTLMLGAIKKVWG